MASEGVASTFIVLPDKGERDQAEFFDDAEAAVAFAHEEAAEQGKTMWVYRSVMCIKVSDDQGVICAKTPEGTING